MNNFHIHLDEHFLLWETLIEDILTAGSFELICLTNWK